MNQQTIQKSKSIHKSVRLMIVLAVVAGLLLAGYFFILSPMLEDEVVAETVVCTPIWESEVESSNGRVLMYPHYERSAIRRVTINNPDNAKFGQQYVSWGFYKYEGPEENEDNLVPGTFYLTNYEYAPFDNTALSNVVVGSGYTLAITRVEDHCNDYSRYGLDYATPEEAVSVTIDVVHTDEATGATENRTYTYYVGDKTPSGSGYYVRVVGEDKLLSTGETRERDSVYILSPNNLEAALLSSPVELVTPSLTLPYDSSAGQLLKSFSIWRYEDQYLDVKVGEDGKEEIILRPAIELKPLNEATDPFAQYAGLSVYYMTSHPGYYASTRFETLVSLFADFQGSEVMELAEKLVDEDGEYYYDFSDEIFEKYGLGETQRKYAMQYTIAYGEEGIENYVFFSELMEDSYYYAYSLPYNTICKVSVEDAYFLQWEDQAFIMNQLVYLGIDKCDSVKVSGSFFDLGVAGAGREGLQEINETYQLTGTGTNLVIKTADGKTLNTTEFREFYQVLISVANRGKVSEEDAKAAMEKAPVATFEVSTRRRVAYKVDENGVSTGEEDYVLESVTKKYRFYTLTEGRLFCTIEDINEKGESAGEVGSFYVLSSRLDQVFAATQDLRDGLDVDEHQRY